MRRRFTPEQLVTIYLNQADFGKDLVGAENASLHYYGKHASDLDTAQAAMIAGLLKSPTMYARRRTLPRVRGSAVGEGLKKEVSWVIGKGGPCDGALVGGAYNRTAQVANG
jgi:membrane peptidoglycan carboxypeptidase